MSNLNPEVRFEFIFGMFFFDLGLINAGLVTKLSWVYLLTLLLFVLVQLKSRQLIFGLNHKLVKAV